LENAPTPQFFNHHVRQFVGLAQCLGRWRQPAGQRSQIRRGKWPNLHSLERQDEIFPPRLRPF